MDTSRSAAAEVSEELTRIILGADAHYRTAKGGGSVLDAEGLVPVHWSELKPEPIPFSEAHTALQNSLVKASQLSGSWARNWLTEQICAFYNLLRWVSDESLPYEAAVAGCLRIDPAPPSARHIQRLVEIQDTALEQAGFRAGRAGYEAYLEADTVSSAALESVIKALIGEAYTLTKTTMPQLILPDDLMQVKLVQGVPFNAYADYYGRAMWINSDLSYTGSQLKQLVCHETYPGHDAHMHHRNMLLKQGGILPDSALVVTNTASSVLFEGIAEAGPDMLAWRQSPLDGVAEAHNRLQQAMSVLVAHGLNTKTMTEAEARAALANTLYVDETWIEGRLRFVTHRLRAPFIYTYWWGNRIVRGWWLGLDGYQRAKATRHIYDYMHSPMTLLAHWHGEL